MAHEHPEYETWEHLASEWDPVREYCRQRVGECLSRLSAKDTTPDIVQVRVYQAEMNVLKEIANLPEERLSAVAKQTKHVKEANKHGR